MEREELMKAVRAAHAAGDTSGARRLMQMADSLAPPQNNRRGPSESIADYRTRLTATPQDADPRSQASRAFDAEFEAGLETRTPAAPRQRTRAAAQGLTLGFGDEIEARARSISPNQTYDSALGDVRGKLDAYRADRPIESTAYEIGGAFAPALIPGYGQATTARVLGRAALEGGAYAFGTGEGGASERLARVPGGAIGGTIGGAIGQGATRALGAAATGLLRGARNVLGPQGATVVQNEIQRLVRQTQKTEGEIVQDIIDGRLLAENETVQMAVRAYRTQGGEASTEIMDAMNPRPAATRGAVMDELRSGMGDAAPGSQASVNRVSEVATRAAEREAYGSLGGAPATDEATASLADALRRVPSAAKEVEIQIRAQEGTAPFFNIDEAGEVVFTRQPTLLEAESVRRAIGNRATNLFRTENMGGAGEAVAGVEQTLRRTLDDSSGPLVGVRSQAALVRTNRDAYTAGNRALSGDVNEKLADFADISSGANAGEAVSSFRAGLMQALEARAATGSRASMIRNMRDPTTKEGMLLNEVFPQDQLDNMLLRIDVANDAQNAQRTIMGGSPTTDTAQEIARQGLGLSASDVMEAVRGSPAAIARLTSKIWGKIGNTDLTDAQRSQIVKILVSEDPELVRSAMTDQRAMTGLIEKAQQLTNSVAGGIGRSATTAGAMSGGPMTGGLLSPSGPQ
jgi:hypothetical protein